MKKLFRNAKLDRLSKSLDAVDAFCRDEVDHLKARLETNDFADLEARLGQLTSAVAELDGFVPPPPKHLQQRVVGGFSKDFLNSGYTLVGNVDEILKSHGKSLDECRRVLEWGCGCGRSLRALKQLHPKLDLYGTDIDPEAIAWLQNNYGSIASFKTNGAHPPMAHHDGAFDLIYAVSVFTHLPEDMQFQWLEDLARLLDKDGIALLSIHGDTHHSNQSAEGQRQLKETGFYYDTGAHTTDGLPDFYLNSYHTAAYIEREWSKYFDVKGIAALGFEKHQDVVVVSRKSV